MLSINKFTFLMKCIPGSKQNCSQRNDWIIDESKFFQVEDIQKLRKVCLEAKQIGLLKRKFTQIRHWFMVELGLNTGLRVEEMASLRHNNLFLDGNRSSIVVTGKGNKKRAIWISSGFKKTCQEYIAYKNSFNYTTGDDCFLLNNLKGEKINKRSLQKFFKKLLNQAGLPNYYYIHCLRHTYTTYLLKASNQNYRFAQQQLGHSSIKTTQVYAGVVESDGRIAIEKLYNS